jgi:hypothetical protein
MDSQTIVELLNRAIQDRSSRSEIVPRDVKARRVFWNNELNRWYGVDSQIYRSGDRMKTSEDYIIVGNLPKRCYNQTRGSCSLRPEFYENLDSPHKNTAGLMANDSSYSRAMFSSERFPEKEISREMTKRYSDVEEKMERRDETEESEDIERRREKNREMMEKMMGGDSKEYEYEYEEEE